MAELHLLTINLWNGRAQAQALDRVLHTHDPDVVVAQELSPCAAEVLAAHYPHTWLRPRTDTLGMGVAARAPCEFRDLPMPRRDFIAARLRPTGWPATAPALEVINVHLSCPERPGRLAERFTQIRRLRALTRERPGPRVLAGDFNTTVPMLAYFALRAHFDDAAWQVALRERHPRAWPRPTWGPTAEAARVVRIDHIFVEELRALALQTVRVEGSDHDGLLARLAYRNDSTSPP